MAHGGRRLPPMICGHNGMLTRRKSRLLGIPPTTTMIIVTFVTLLGVQASPAQGIWPFDPSRATSESNCIGNHGNCTQRGIRVSSNPTVQEVTNCCANSCFDRLGAATIDYELSADLLVNNYGCSATFILSSTRSCADETVCSAIDECEGH
ncbi:hypothetical protein niasHT_029034 [Heterodera trifolii]|uniref:Uncharacterized protein n=1 Tax=Heterodera trifolii TaxID=157864 RepID=A0ABD2K8J1_9BILA